MNNQRVLSQLHSGMQALDSGNVDAAEQIFRRILAQNDSEVHSLHFLGVIMCQKGNLSDGIALIEQSIRLDPSRFGPYINLGRFLCQANQWDRAIAALQKAVRKDLNSFDAWSMLAQASFFAGDADAALMAAKKAAKINPENAEIFFSLGIYASRTNADEAIDYYQKSISIDPNSPKSFVNLGYCMLDNQRIDEAIASFNKALVIENNCFQALMGLSRAFENLANWSESLDAASFALSSDPSSHYAAFRVGFLLHKLERKHDAVSAYRVALNILPVAAQTHFYLASVLEELGDRKNAIGHFEMATNIDPTLSSAFTRWGSLLQKEGDVSLAIDKHRQAVRSDPSSANAFLNLSYALQEAGNCEEAIDSCRKAIEAKRDFVDAYLYLGKLLLDVGKLDEVRQIIGILRRMDFVGKQAQIAVKDKFLVFDWFQRRVLSLAWEVELSAALSVNHSSCLAAVKHTNALYFPPSFLGQEDSCNERRKLYRSGFLVEDELLSPDLCDKLTNQFDFNNSMDIEAIELLNSSQCFYTVLERILLHTGFPHLIWNCIYFVKGPGDRSASDAWHYDNHYNIWTPKLIVYLNSQLEGSGATHFVDASLSWQISEESDYMGLIWQRDNYKNLVGNLVNDQNISQSTFDPEYYSFSPNHAGSGVWFCPARTLHRGIGPKSGLRHVLSFSFTPLPANCLWSVDHCVEKSVEILKDKIIKGMQRNDVNPYWISNASCA